MSLDTVEEDIRDEARARAQEIREEAEARAEEILEQAEADAEEIEAEREDEVARQIEQEREQSLSSAKLEAKQERLEARRDVLDEVRTAVEAEIADIGGDTREGLTQSLLESGRAEFDDESAIEVFGRAEDADLLESICSAEEFLSHAGEAECLGGVVLESEGSRIRVDNTFDSVLDDVWEDNLRNISERLFDEQ